MNAQLYSFLSRSPKYKLVFDLVSQLDVESIDTGKYLSVALQSKLQKSMLNMYASDAIRKMIRENTKESPEVGRYIAMDNIGILFEPALAYNLESILEQTSKDELLIIRAKGKVKNDKFYFFSPHQDFTINLKNLNYTVIE